MARTRELELRHSVAFRVTEEQWQRLKSAAAKEGITIPRLAKRSLFFAANVEQEAEVKRSYSRSKGS